MNSGKPKFFARGHSNRLGVPMSDLAAGDRPEQSRLAAVVSAQTAS